jgi:hypothetical protein
VCAEASAVLGAVAADLFSYLWCLEIPSDNRVRQVPRCVHYRAELWIGNVLGVVQVKLIIINKRAR